jgi:hypothetical protein
MDYQILTQRNKLCIKTYSYLVVKDHPNIHLKSLQPVSPATAS